jgi:predicted ATPase
LKGILGDAQQIHDRAFHYATQFFADITREQTAVIFLEDIHWADRGSLDFFSHLMNTKPDLPLLIVGLTRATLFEERPDWGTAGVQTTQLDLLPLSDESCRRLVAEILQKVRNSACSTDLIHAADGARLWYYVIKVPMTRVIIRGEDQWRWKWALNLRSGDTDGTPATLDNLNLNTRAAGFRCWSLF